MKFLGSRGFSLFCCALNVGFGIQAAMAHNWLIFGVCSVFAVMCFHNFKQAR